MTRLLQPLRRPLGAEALYRRIEADFRTRIAAGQWAPESMLPGRHALARDLGVSLRTIERAIASLLNDGTLRADDRRGTFVNRVTAVVTAESVTAIEPHSALPRGTVAVVVRSEIDLLGNDASQGFWTPTVARSLERELLAAGIAVRYYQVELQRGSYPDIDSAFAAAVADGVADLALLSPAGEFGLGQSANNQLIRCWHAGLPPAVVVSGEPVELPPPAVFSDQRRAGYDAARHLIDAGYTQIVGLETRPQAWLALRLAGAEAAVAHYLDATWMRLTGDDLGALLLQIPAGAAVIAANDGQALEILAWLRARDIRPGRDLGVIGFDDDHAGRLANLTSLAPPLEDLGRTAARIIIDRRRGQVVPASTRLAHRLLVRDTTHLEAVLCV